ncbi:exodeoxyribonuclease III [Mesosutterella sp. AGMB02718]|uniref:Exodeoxyribonuclease III n=1 Tax=Mesosutterella faecium TaxID=2925194 RepID=A0ABT7ILD4_9BURK|nr:exodeoxyribonuclease III [Mesosutterella sp. AGMB02718]MDL2059171.1 exodeoxyribonuclease III [Mesosutterella sp. AGMB02718]
MKIATWNVNSLKVRLEQVLAFLEKTKCDALGLQETKLQDDFFPEEAFEKAGYGCFFSGQKTYNGVAVLVRRDTTRASDPVRGIPGYPDEQKRLIGVTLSKEGCGPVRFFSAYFPNGTAPGSKKYLYKIEWLAALQNFLADELKSHPRLVLAGDMNIAPEDRDVWDPEGWKGHILVSEGERDAFASLLATGLKDAFRLAQQPEGSWSWWDYRHSAFLKNQGLRIDHILVSQPLVPEVSQVVIDRSFRALPQPSDHAPVICTLQEGELSLPL